MEINYEIIEQYILGDLTADELSTFEQKMQTDSEFKKEVELYIEINKGLKNKYQNLEKEQSLKATLDKMGTKHFDASKQNKKQNKGNFRANILRISALAAILVIGVFLLKPQTNLYDEFAIHEKMEIQVKGANDELLLEASELYNNKNYEEASTLFESFLRENPEDLEVQMALGISLLESEKLDDAKIVFSHVYASKSIFTNKASWYLALANIKSKDYDLSREFLKEIDENSFYGKKAQKLLKKLKSKK